MALTDAPQIRIGGQAVASSWTDTGRIGLEGVKITWGRSSHLDKASPAQLYCELIDPRAHLDGYQALTGKPIEVWRAASATDPARRIFNGRIDDYDVEIRWISDPHTYERRRVWVLSIQASDKLAELAKAVLPGPGGVDLIEDAVGPGYWGFLTKLTQSGVVTPARHIVSMMEGGAKDIVRAIDWRDPYPDEDTAVRVIPWSERRSLLDMIEGMYATHPLGYPIYEPSSNSVLIGKPAVGPAVKLVYAGGVINMQVGTTGYAIPASKVVVPDGYKAATGADESIDVVQVVSSATQIAIVDGKMEINFHETVTENAVADYDLPAVGRREHRIDVDLLLESVLPENPDPDPEAPGGDYVWPFPLSTVVSEYGWREWSQSFHEGIDFTYPGIAGAAIHPVGAGTVSRILSVNDGTHGWGNGVIVDHGAGLSTLYAHMPSAPPVMVGSVVDSSMVIGYVGSTGNSTGPHLHLETWVNGQHMNPRSWMDQYGHELQATAGEGSGHVQELIAADTADALEQIRGAAVMPTLRLDWRNFDYDYPITYGWLDTACKQVPVYFPGSVFADLLDISRVHQFIGGTLVYADGGWTHDLTAAPALMAYAGLTVDELVTTDTPLLGEYADDISIADLGNVHEGIHA